EEPSDVRVDQIEAADVDDEAGSAVPLDRGQDVGLEGVGDRVPQLDVDHREERAADPKDRDRAVAHDEVPPAAPVGGAAASRISLPTIPSASSMPSLRRLTVCIAEMSTPSWTMVRATCAVMPVRTVCAPSSRTAAVVLRR